MPGRLSLGSKNEYNGQAKGLGVGNPGLLLAHGVVGVVDRLDRLVSSLLVGNAVPRDAVPQVVEAHVLILHSRTSETSCAWDESSTAASAALHCRCLRSCLYKLLE